MIENEEYRRLIENPSVKLTNIELISSPEKVWRYRRFGKMNGTKWEENEFWKEDISGICYFSIPSEFNKNDDSDCKVKFDNDEIIKHMIKRCGLREAEMRKGLKKTLYKELNEYKKELQSKLRVSCFSEVKPTEMNMWKNENFGDFGRGICIEYKVDDMNFRPDGLPFLPILYDDELYDSTDVIKAIIDFINDDSDIGAMTKMVCLGYGHTLIKPRDYINEKEWRIVIPIRDDGAHKNYYNYDNESKRDMCSAITAFYLGYNMDSLSRCQEYLNDILDVAKEIKVPVYRLINENGVLKKQIINY